jgi:hypothetical protein
MQFVYSKDKSTDIRKTVEKICSDFRTQCSEKIISAISSREEGFSDFILDKIVFQTSTKQEAQNKYTGKIFYLRPMAQLDIEKWTVWIGEHGMPAEDFEEIESFTNDIYLKYAESSGLPDFYIPAYLFLMYFFKKTKNSEELKKELLNKTAPFLAAVIEVSEKQTTVEVTIKPRNSFEKSELYQKVLGEFSGLEPKKSKQMKADRYLIPPKR